MKFNKITLAGMVLCGSVLMTACGGDSDIPAQVASGNVTATINPTAGAAAVAAVKDQNFQFSSGVANFGTTAATTLKLSGSNTAPAFAINSGTNSATGVMTFGSCIFTVTASTFAAGHPLALGQVLTVTPCAVTVATGGQAVTGNAASTNVTLQLGTTTSSPVAVTATINQNGSVTINGAVVGTVTVANGTGASN